MDIEKAFDSLYHSFFVSTLEKYIFGKNLICWVKTLLEIRTLLDQELGVFNGKIITKYFLFGRGALLGNPISPFFIKSKPEIEGLIIFDHFFLYTAYDNDEIFFLKNTIFIKQMVNTFHLSILFRIKTKLVRLQVLDF